MNSHQNSPALVSRSILRLFLHIYIYIYIFRWDYFLGSRSVGHWGIVREEEGSLLSLSLTGFVYLWSSHTQKSSRALDVCPSSPLIRWLIIFFPSLQDENWRAALVGGAEAKYIKKKREKSGPSCTLVGCAKKLAMNTNGRLNRRCVVKVERCRGVMRWISCSRDYWSWGLFPSTQRRSYTRSAAPSPSRLSLSLLLYFRSSLSPWPIDETY